jgi:hypothetical protein
MIRNTTTSLFALSLVAAAPSYGATRDDIYQAFQRCNAMGDNRAWLDCIYGAVQPMRVELGLPPALANQVKLVPPATGAATPAKVPAASGR